MGGAQILSGGYSCTLSRTAADQTANFTVQLHLRRGRCYQPIQSSV